VALAPTLEVDEMLRALTPAQRGRFRSLSALLLGTLLLTAAQFASARDAAILSSRDVFHPVVAHHGIVSSQESTATKIGVDILKKGGNAVDAAVAVGFALAVTLPRAGNIGGGGFMLVHMAGSGETVAIDYREMAPAGATRDMYLDAAGNVDKQRARSSYLSAGVPGTVAGMALALEKYGTMSLSPSRARALPSLRSCPLRYNDGQSAWRSTRLRRAYS
jgi:gamma-glutamyltranspeptidase/glutathione hydrolase